MTAAIVIQRANRGWRDRYRSYEVIVNEKFQAEIWRGEELRIEIDPGKTEVYLKIDWCSSRRLHMNLENGSEQRLLCRSRSLLTVIYGVTFGRHNYIQLEAPGEADESARNDAP